MPRGGARDGAGRKRKYGDSKTTPYRIPAAIEGKIIDEFSEMVATLELHGIDVSKMTVAEIIEAYAKLTRQ